MLQWDTVFTDRDTLGDASCSTKYVKSPKEAKESRDGDVYIFYLAKFAVSLGQIEKFTRAYIWPL
jgi:hypothetical protein